MREIEYEDGFPERTPCPYGYKETRNEDEDAASADRSPSEFAQGAAAHDEPEETDNDPECDEVGSKQKRGSSEGTNSEVEGSEAGLGGGGVWLLLAAEEEVEGKELEEEAVLFGEVAWSGKRSKEIKEEGESEEGGESAEGLS